MTKRAAIVIWTLVAFSPFAISFAAWYFDEDWILAALIVPFALLLAA